MNVKSKKGNWAQNIYGVKPITRRELDSMDPFKHPGIKVSDLPEPDAFMKPYCEKIQKIYQRLKEKGETNPEVFLKESNKVKKEFYKELTKKYPESKKEIENLQKEMDKFAKVKLDFYKLLQIGKKRKLTGKEEKELENISVRLKQLKLK